MRTLVEVEETILFEVHCKMCGEKLGYFLEADNSDCELAEMSARCLRCPDGKTYD